MKPPFSLQSVALLALARSQAAYAGELGLGQLSRLVQDSLARDPATPVHYAFSARMQRDAAGQDEPWLHLQADTVLTLECQRCLQPMDCTLAFARDFRFVATEELAAIEDEESEEDVLELAPAFDLQALIEDELLMAQPAAPLHAVCPQPVRLSARDPDFVDPQPEKPNPFAVLQRLKSKD